MIPVPSNTLEAIGNGAQHCDSRSLLSAKFVFLQRIPESRQIALDTFVDGGLDRLSAMRAKWRETADNSRSERDVQEAKDNLNDTEPLRERTIEAPVDTRFSERWLKFLKTDLRLADAELLFAQLQSRLMVDMAGGVLENAGLNFDRWSGLPVIPGSAVKGCARRLSLAALREWSESKSSGRLDEATNAYAPACKDFESPETMLAAIAEAFGWVEQDWEENGDFRWACCDRKDVFNAAAMALANSCSLTLDPAKPLPKQLGSRVGGAVFLAAWPVAYPGVPDQPKLGKLELDILTSHHPEYYKEPPEPDLPHSDRKWLEWKREHDEWQREWGNAPDVEAPNPVVFPAVARGHVFVFTVTAKDTVVGNLTRRWLSLGLEILGLGSKTAAGYGWFLPLDRRDSFVQEQDHRLAEAQGRHELLLQQEAERQASSAREAEEKKKQEEVEADQQRADEAKAQAELLARRTPNEWLQTFTAISDDQKFAETAKRFPTMLEAERQGFAMALAYESRKDTRKRWSKKKPELIQPWIEFAAKLSPPIPL
jgi:CRISPR-associated protein Cmr6